MLREVGKAGWEEQRSWLRRRYVFVCGTTRAARGLRPAAFAAAQVAQRERAVPVLHDGGRAYWWCLDRFYVSDRELSADDVYALAYERRVRARRTLQRAHETVRLGRTPPARRQGVPLAVRRAVWDRDGGSCAECGSEFELQFDHVIPVALGGATTAENLQVLCGGCNRAKGASLG